LLHASLRHAAKIALNLLNKNCSYTDDCDVYRLSICTFILSLLTRGNRDQYHEVLHPQFKTFYFSHYKWPQESIDEASSLLRTVWTTSYKPAPVDKPLQPAPVSAPASAGSRAKRTPVNFDIVLNYGHQARQEPDALEEYLKAPPLPLERDPIGYWLRQRKGGEIMADPAAIALAQMALDYLSVPATSVDPERVFSFSGGSITKLRHQLSDDSARPVVMVGLWSKVDGLLPEQEFEMKIEEGWSRSRKRKASVDSIDEPPRKVVVMHSDGST